MILVHGDCDGDDGGVHGVAGEDSGAYFPLCIFSEKGSVSHPPKSSSCFRIPSSSSSSLDWNLCGLRSLKKNKGSAAILSCNWHIEDEKLIGAKLDL
ncbi:hypothetical protein M0R45_033290 [Rubus argutus]|uniref:Uncharacterized protein n=1 Tax=Rubus argutus TaxID=59490 RepID=A0AAW1WLY2_RUBAR